MRGPSSAIILLLILAVAAPLAVAQKYAALSPAETEKLRDTQDPGKRIEAYLDLMQARLSRFEAERAQPTAPPATIDKVLDGLLTQYVELDDEMKGWIQYQFNREGDMRGGLRALLSRGSEQLAKLHRAEQGPGASAAPYYSDLQNAVADLEDTLNGGTEALAQQTKKLGELKAGSKPAVKLSKAAIKEEKKRIKQDEKLRKKEREERVESNP